MGAQNDRHSFVKQFILRYPTSNSAAYPNLVEAINKFSIYATETPDHIFALERNVEIIDNSEEMTSDDEWIDGEQNVNFLAENDDTSKLYR